jgi:hypothetical protein
MEDFSTGIESYSQKPTGIFNRPNFIKAGIAFFSVILVTTLFDIYCNNLLKKDYAFKLGKVDHYLWQHDKYKDAYIIFASFDADGKTYTSQAVIHSPKSKKLEDMLDEKLFHKGIEIAYVPKWPSKNQALLTANDFSYYNKTLPDSLRWIDEMINADKK